MGRPPLGKQAMSDAERQRRHRAAHPVTKPVTKPAAQAAAQAAAEIAALKAQIASLKARIAELDRDNVALKARIAELETEIARLRVGAGRGDAAPAANGSGPRAGAARGDAAPAANSSGPNAQISKFIRHLGNANQVEAEVAARKLVSGLAASESDRHTLAELWEKHCEKQARQRPPRPEPVDWPEVKRAVKRYAEFKTKVNINNVHKAIRTQMPALTGGTNTFNYLIRCLEELGFVVKRGQWTYERR
jgi:hypothetical protein